jgi:signal peptidase I
LWRIDCANNPQAMPTPERTTASPPTNAASRRQDYDAHLPSWQTWLNVTCENWIFAFLVAMAIRHFVLEAFRIPSASMEPTLYGDPAFLKGDNVLVDKLLFRFTGPRRWDVTVFQVPQPEIEGGSDAISALDFDNRRLDTVLLRPLMYRNFVKRTIILPGERFYIFGGDVYIQQPDKSFKVPHKPPEVQEALWQTIYHHNEQPDYLPWQGDGASTVTAAGENLTMSLHGADGVRFTQPFRNLYLKPGPFLIRPLLDSNDGRPTAEGGEQIELSMTKPVFYYRAGGRTGNVWDMDQWAVNRLNSHDLEIGGSGVALNQTMTEFVGDIRINTTISALTGSVTLQLVQGNVHTYRLNLTATGWTVAQDGTVVTRGSTSLIGKKLSFGHLDNQVILSIDGVSTWAGDVTPVDPNLERLGLTVCGTGTVTMAGMTIQRDVHYTSTFSGSFLCDASDIVSRLEHDLDDPNNEHLDHDKDTLRTIFRVRAEMLGIHVDPAHYDALTLTQAQKTDPIGYSPKTAITAPGNAYLMMGDNSPQSFDSRGWGFVPKDNLRGRVLAIILPPNRLRLVH